MLARLRALDADPRVRSIATTAIALTLIGGVIGLTGSAPAPTASARVPELPSAPRVPAAAPGALQALTSAPASGTAPAPDTVTVQGVGSVSGTPDVLLLSVTISVRRSTVAAALDAANAATSKVTASLRSHGVASRDIQTTGLNVSTAYDYSNNEQKKVGYDASHSLTARLRGGSSKDGATISAAATSSGDDVSISGLSFDLENSDALISKARDRAFADAKDKATQYAKLAGRSLGPVLGISEVSSSAPPPVYSGPTAAGSAAAAIPVPVESGSQVIGVVVTITWQLT